MNIFHLADYYLTLTCEEAFNDQIILLSKNYDDGPSVSRLLQSVTVRLTPVFWFRLCSDV